MNALGAGGSSPIAAETQNARIPPNPATMEPTDATFMDFNPSLWEAMGRRCVID
jgi:hypothetical protein